MSGQVVGTYVHYFGTSHACMQGVGLGCVLSAVQVQISEGVLIAVPGALPTTPLFPASQMFQGLSFCLPLLDPDLDLAPCLAWRGKAGKTGLA